uniref:Kunitz-type protease inhibitor 1-like n=1 Tax=Acanthochromis polyacanthus TaxID=80966 RepID=A0A3Q1FP07_9TELE
MPSSTSSSSLRPFLLFLLLLQLRPGEAAEDCDASFRSGEDNFVLDTEDAVKEGAAPLATAHVQSPEECRSACCSNLRCNLALLEPCDSKENCTCVLFSCVHRNRFVCRFVNQVGYQSYIRETVFEKYLQAPPIAIAGRDVVIQPGETVMLNGIESLALNDARITDYSWSLQSGDSGVKMEKTDLPDQVKLSNLQPGYYVFQLTVTDSNGQSDNTNVKVLVLSPEMSSLFCGAPVKVGPCRAAFSRWRYDAATGSCEQFVFGGCKPNKNNYLSKEECVSACRGVTGTRSIHILHTVHGQHTHTHTHTHTIQIQYTHNTSHTEVSNMRPSRGSSLVHGTTLQSVKITEKTLTANCKFAKR